MSAVETAARVLVARLNANMRPFTLRMWMRDQTFSSGSVPEALRELVQAVDAEDRDGPKIADADVANANKVLLEGIANSEATLMDLSMRLRSLADIARAAHGVAASSIRCAKGGRS